jgi:hypothetical protein
MASLRLIRTAVANLITANITSDPRITAYRTLQSVKATPAVVVGPASSNFAAAMKRGADQWLLNLHVLVSDTDTTIGQDLLDDLIDGEGSRSIRAVIFDNPTLGLPNVNAHIAGLAAYGVTFEATPLQHIGATLQLAVVTTRST